MTARVVLASGNRGKIAELHTMLEPLGLEVVPQAQLGIADAEEPAPTFVENALLKARHAAARCDFPVIADDSGLEVPALGGAPGIYSARYSGTHGNDVANNAKLLEAMQAFSGAARQASFRCVAVFMRRPDDPVPIVAEGVWHGEILTAPRGHGGFGYDPLFYVAALGQTGAELDPAHKNKISHRGLALAELRRKIAAVL